MFVYFLFLFQHKYKEAFEKMKGQMVGSCGLDGDIHIAHSVHASSLQSDVSTRKKMWTFWN